MYICIYYYIYLYVEVVNNIIKYNRVLNYILLKFIIKYHSNMIFLL